MEATQKLTRVQLDFSPRLMTLVKRLKRQLQESSRANLIRSALQFYAWVADMARGGWRLALIRDGRACEVTLPFDCQKRYEETALASILLPHTLQVVVRVDMLTARDSGLVGVFEGDDDVRTAIHDALADEGSCRYSFSVRPLVLNERANPNKNYLIEQRR